VTYWYEALAGLVATDAGQAVVLSAR
jgi:hypothetical protein